MSDSKFVHLHTHSHYSLLDGMSRIDELVSQAKKLGMSAVALTDHGNLYGAVEFYKKAKAAGVKPILGVEAYIAPGDHKDKNAGVSDERYYHLVLLAKNKTGWENLLKLVTQSYLEGFYYKPRMDKAMLRAHSEGLIALSGCLSGEVSRALLANDLVGAEAVAHEYQDIFGKDNYYIEVQSHSKIDDVNTARPRQIALAKKIGAPMVATQDSHYIHEGDAPIHDILLCIQTGRIVTDTKRMSMEDDFSFKSGADMEAAFKDIPEAIENTFKIAEQCNFEMELGKILLPRFETPDGSTPVDYLKKMVEEKIKDRFPIITDEVRKRTDYELGVITKTGFSDYFLIVADFINWAKDRGIVVGPGRGSAAGSIISYILRITDLDPLHYGLLFERFLNPDRIQMPDIDIDIADTRRGEVFAYIQEKYGIDHVAHIVTFGTMAARASIRDVGRALDIELPFCDRLAKLIPFNKDLEESLKSVTELADIYKKDERAKKIIDAAKRLEGVARHASVHACGTVIASELLVKRVPVQHAPQDDSVVITQFDMYSVEDIGLLKMDILGLKNLTIIEEAIRHIRELTDVNIDISKIPLDDKKTFEMLQKADTTGVFQFESGGMRRYLKELRPTELEDLIAMVSLYRPGPMELIPSYIARKHGREEVTYMHPRLEPILKNTYGIGVYQEQMMRIASDMAGFTLSQADTLRKAIGKKIKKLLDEQEEKIVSGLIKNGIPEKTAKAIWDLFPPFARYGFNRSHGACYAMIAYQTAYLKANYPVALMTAVFNAESGDVERISFLINEAKKMKIAVLPPDINKSSAAFTPEGEGIRFGMAAIKNVGDNIVGAIIAEREKGGPFDSFASFVCRVNHKDLNRKSLENLAKCGALDSLGLERNRILANMDEIIKFIGAFKKQGQSNSQVGLFGASLAHSVNKEALQFKEAEPVPAAQRLIWEKELLGLYVSDHPLNTAKEKILGMKPALIKDVLLERSGVKSYRICGMVASVKAIITKTGKPMAFVKIEDETGSIETVLFSDTYDKTKAIWKEGAIVALTGRLNFRNGEVSLVCENAKEI